MASITTLSPSGQREKIATQLVFFISGLGMAAWAPLVPFAKARIGMNEAGLGLVLLCLGTGSILAMPVAGVLVARTGCRSVIIVSALLTALALPLLALVSSRPVLGAALLVFGAGLGALDVAMNIMAISVERMSGRAMMSRFHGLFSLGGICGAAGVAALLAAGAAPVTATLLVVTGIAVALWRAAPHLPRAGGQSNGPMFAFPRGVVWFIGAACFVLFLTEGAVLDWSAVFLTSVRNIGASDAGLGYAAFALTMTTSRLFGGRIVQYFGNANILLFGGMAAATGFAVVTFVPAWPASLFGFAAIGAGCANIVPVLYTSVGRQTIMPEHLAVPAITTFGYAGILLGPAAIGLVAQAISLSAAFMILALMLIGVAASFRLLRL